MKSIAIIPARSCSKGLKDKNIRLLNGKPLLAYSVEAALESGVFDEVMVSTDSEKYAEIAKEYGASVPFLRSAELSSDTATSKDVILDTLKSLSACFFRSEEMEKTMSDAERIKDILAQRECEQSTTSSDTPEKT